MATESIVACTVSLSDDRGQITNVLERDDLKHVSVITCKKGATRGNHFHRKEVQYLYVVSGTFRSESRDVNTEECHAAIVKPGHLIITPPCVAHKLTALSSGILVQISTAPRIAMEHTDTFDYKL